LFVSAKTNDGEYQCLCTISRRASQGIIRRQPFQERRNPNFAPRQPRPLGITESRLGSRHVASARLSRASARRTGTLPRCDSRPQACPCKTPRSAAPQPAPGRRSVDRRVEPSPRGRSSGAAPARLTHSNQSFAVGSSMSSAVGSGPPPARQPGNRNNRYVRDFQRVYGPSGRSRPPGPEQPAILRLCAVCAAT